jgi:hypothetical protein
MSNKNPKLVAEKHGGAKYFVIDGQSYVFDPRKKEQIGKKRITINLTPVDKKKFEAMVDGLAEKLAKQVDVKELLRQALYDTPFEDIQLAKKEMEKEKPKVVSKKGCLFLKVGKGKIWLRE